MPLLIEQQTRDIGVVRTPVGPERTRVVVRPGDTFRFVDDAAQTSAPIPGLKVKRLDNNLIIDGLPGGQVIELNNFFGACRPGAECTVQLDGLGAKGATVTEETVPTAPLADGSFLLYGDPTAASALPAAQQAGASGPSWGAIGGVIGGVALAGAAAGGGGGGGGGGGPVVDNSAPPAPVLTSGAAVKQSAPIVTGEAEANARVFLRVDVNGNGQFTDPADATFVTTADANGQWSIDLRGTPQSGALPAGGLVENVPYQLLLQVVDAAQNVSPSVRSTLTVDGTLPAVPIVNLIAGDDVVNAAERAAGITLSGTAEAGSVVTVAVGDATGSATTSASGEWSIGLAGAALPTAGVVTVSAVATDAAGNASAPGTRQVVFETNVPGAPIITDNVTGTATGPVTFTFTFDKPVSGITADDIAVTGGAKGTFTAVSASVYTLVVTPSAGVQSGQIVVQLAAGAGADAAGNPTTAASPIIQAYDTAPPTVSLANNATGVATGPVTYTVTFSEAVTGFALGDVVVTGGTAGQFTGSGTTYGFVVTPAAGASGEIRVNIPAAAAVDAVGLPSAALAATSVVTFDTAPPTLVSITDPVTGTTNGPVTYTFTFSEAVTGFGLDDIVITGGTGAMSALAGSGASYTAVYTPGAGDSGPVTLSVGPGLVIDGALNANVGTTSSAAQQFDLAAPTITVADTTPGQTASGPVTFNFTLSEPSTTFAAGDITFSGGTLGGFTGSGASYSAVVTPAADSTGIISVSVAAGTFTDAVGNANLASNVQTQAFDTNVPPTIIVADSTAGQTATGPVTFTFTLSEPSTTFAAGDITFSGGTLGSFTGSGTSYSAILTPAADTSGLITVSVAAGTFTDAIGNPNLASNVQTQAFDTTVPPTITVADTTPGATATGPVTFNFTLSEPSTTFGSDDITFSGGTLSGFTGSGTSYSAVLTPAADTSGVLSVSVAAGRFTDSTGNANLASNVQTQAFNTVVPPTIVVADTQPATTATGPVTFTFTLSEASTTFAVEDIGITGGSLGALTGSGASYSIVATPTPGTQGTMTVSVAAGTFTDAAGNLNVSGGSQSQLYDLQAPTQTVTTASGTGTPATPTTVSITLSAVLAPGDTVTLTRDGAVTLGPPTVAASTLTFTDATLPAGAYNYSATISDSFNNVRALDFLPGTPGTNPLLVNIA